MIKSYFSFFTIVIAAIQFSCSSQNKLAEKPISAQLKLHNKAVHLLGSKWMRDPYILLAPDGFYYLSFTQENIAFPNSEAAMQFFRSTDLINWEDLGIQWKINDSPWGKLLQNKYEQALKVRGNNDQKNQEEKIVSDPFSGSKINTKNQQGPKLPMIRAPEVHYIDNQWVVVTTSNQMAANLFTTSGSKLKGPLNEPFANNFGHRHDPSIFMDDSTPWLVYACTKIIKLKKDFSGFDGNDISISHLTESLGMKGASSISLATITFYSAPPGVMIHYATALTIYIILFPTALPADMVPVSLLAAF